MGVSGTGFSLWILVFAWTNPRRLKPAPLARVQDGVRVLRGDIREAAATSKSHSYTNPANSR